MEIIKMISKKDSKTDNNKKLNFDLTNVLKSKLCHSAHIYQGEPCAE